MAVNSSAAGSTDNAVVYSTRLPVLYTVIPASIRKRMPRFYSMHKRWSSNSHDTKRTSNEHHHRTLTISSESNVALCQAASENALAPGDMGLRRPATAPGEMREASISTSQSVSYASEGDVTTALPATSYETESGLRWNRVVPAFNLLRNAGYEAQQPQADDRLVRSLYVNALVYLLDALPDDLTHEEARSLHQKLPEKVHSNLHSCLSCSSCHHHHHPLSESGVAGSKPASYEPSYLHRLLASSIVQFFLLVQFLMPHVKVFIREMYRYERSHRITERVVAAALDVADTLGKGGVNLGSTILAMHEGKAGMILSGLAGWWIESVAGGIYEGVGKGMIILGVIRPSSMELEKMAFHMNKR